MTAARSKQLLRQRQMTARLAQDASLDDGVDSEALLDGTAARADDARRALATLRDDDRNVIELCVMGELSPSTVAMLLGQRSSTVRSRLARARRRLADAYTRVSDPDTRCPILVTVRRRRTTLNMASSLHDQPTSASRCAPATEPGCGRRYATPLIARRWQVVLAPQEPSLCMAGGGRAGRQSRQRWWAWLLQHL
jgi:hypothetical protein